MLNECGERSFVGHATTFRKYDQLQLRSGEGRIGNVFLKMKVVHSSKDRKAETSLKVVKIKKTTKFG
jgi:hypothetical protein